MIIERSLRFLAGAAVVLAAWTAILAGLALALPPGTPFAVFALGQVLETVAKADGSFESFGQNIAVTRSPDENFAQRLYGAGALLVIDARIVMSCRALFAKT